MKMSCWILKRYTHTCVHAPPPPPPHTHTHTHTSIMMSSLCRLFPIMSEQPIFTGAKIQWGKFHTWVEINQSEDVPYSTSRQEMKSLDTFLVCLQVSVLSSLTFTTSPLSWRSANKCLIKVAHMCATMQQFDKAASLFEEVCVVDPQEFRPLPFSNNVPLCSTLLADWKKLAWEHTLEVRSKGLFFQGINLPLL